MRPLETSIAIASFIEDGANKDLKNMCKMGLKDSKFHQFHLFLKSFTSVSTKVVDFKKILFVARLPNISKYETCLSAVLFNIFKQFDCLALFSK